MVPCFVTGYRAFRTRDKVLLLPRRPVERPSQEYLEERYELFRKAG